MVSLQHLIVRHNVNVAKQRQQHLQALLNNVSSQFKQYNGDPFLLQLFCMLFNNTNIDSLPPTYKHLGIFQQQIGTHSLHLGLFHDEWLHLQHQFLIRNKLPFQKQQAHSLFKKISITIFDGIHKLWLLCNQHLHCTSTTTPEIRQSYDNKCHMLCEDRGLLHHPLSSFEDWSLQELKYFLHVTGMH